MVEIQFEWLEIRHNCGLGIKKSRKLYRARHPPPYSSREDAVLCYKSTDNLNLSLSMLLISRISVTGTVVVMRGVCQVFI